MKEDMNAAVRELWRSEIVEVLSLVVMGWTGSRGLLRPLEAWERWTE